MKLILTVIIMTTLSLSGCTPKVQGKKNKIFKNSPDSDDKNGKKNKKNNDSDEDDGEDLPEPRTGSTTGSTTDHCGDAGVADADQSQDYYRLTNIIGAGNGSSAAQWTSESLRGSSTASESILVTDERFHLRVKVLPAPSQGSNSFIGSCRFQQRYETLSFQIALSSRHLTSSVETLSFNRMKIDQCSEVLKFTNIPQNDESNPLTLKIINVKSDQSCLWDPSGTDGCNENPPRLYSFWNNNCWELELHISTDETKDIPR